MGHGNRVNCAVMCVILTTPWLQFACSQNVRRLTAPSDVAIRSDSSVTLAEPAQMPIGQKTPVHPQSPIVHRTLTFS